MTIPMAVVNPSERVIRAGRYAFRFGANADTVHVYLVIDNRVEPVPLRGPPIDALHTLLLAHEELQERNADGWRRANLAETSARLQIAAGERLTGGCYRDAQGRERVCETRLLNNCAKAAGEPESNCPMCLGGCPGEDK
jgi:hypothetical protein